METRIRHGIKLFKRVCVVCKDVDFWVPRSSPQKFCSEGCRVDAEQGGKHKPSTVWPYARKKRKVDYVLKEDDYEELD
jgi:hypothetical protein